MTRVVTANHPPDGAFPIIVARSMEGLSMAGATKVPPTTGGESNCASRIEIPNSSPPAFLGREIA